MALHSCVRTISDTKQQQLGRLFNTLWCVKLWERSGEMKEKGSTELE